MKRDERGAVTAELALALPLLLSLTWGLVWLLSLGEAQLRVTDAAREAARAAARGDAVSSCVARAQQVAPGSTVVVTARDGEVEATVTGSASGPGGLLGFLPAVTLHAEATSAAEGT